MITSIYVIRTHMLTLSLLLPLNCDMSMDSCVYARCSFIFFKTNKHTHTTQSSRTDNSVVSKPINYVHPHLFSSSIITFMFAVYHLVVRERCREYIALSCLYTKALNFSKWSWNGHGKCPSDFHFSCSASFHVCIPLLQVSLK